MPFPAELPLILIEKAVLAALEEDLGLAGDLTSQATIAPGAEAKGVIASREAGVVSGLKVVEAAFRLAGSGVSFKARVSDGDAISAGEKIAEISGNARTLLAGERVALNFLCHMSGIATLTRKFADAVATTGARICDTRKTMPGLRAFEKYAVRCGGGWNHRYGLGDAILIKDNHIAVAGGIGNAIKAARAFAGHMVAIEVEVDTLDQLAEAIEAGATAVLLDNMDNAALRRAVELNKGSARLEASGGVTLERVRGIAETGVDFISTSQITMAARPLDLGLDIAIG
jgi:nicotinate-nucleotide pyrophosphorylase (carboxylating)